MKKLFWAVAVVGLLGVGGCVVDPTYDVCNDSLDCEADEQCIEVDTTATGGGTFGTLCTNDCIDSFDCESNFGFPGVCINPQPSTGGALCFQQCDIDLDCFALSNCVLLEEPGTGFIDSVCLPNNG